jgi:hypothetical protein
MDFSGEADQHKVIHAGLEELLTMIHEAQTDLSKFDPEKMNTKMIALKVPLVRFHLYIPVVQVNSISINFPFSTHI